MTSRVFVVQSPRRVSADNKLVDMFDFRPAETFGEVRTLLSPTANPHGDIRALIAEMRRKLADFADADSLLLVGSPILIGLATTIAASMNDGRVAMLQWDGKARKYNRITADSMIGLPGDVKLTREEWESTWASDAGAR